MMMMMQIIFTFVCIYIYTGGQSNNILDGKPTLAELNEIFFDVDSKTFNSDLFHMTQRQASHRDQLMKEEEYVLSMNQIQKKKINGYKQVQIIKIWQNQNQYLAEELTDFVI